MFIIDKIRFMWAVRQMLKYEEYSMFTRKTLICRIKNKIKNTIKRIKEWASITFESKKAKAARLAKEEEERKQRELNYKREVALMFAFRAIQTNDGELLNAVGDKIEEYGLLD